VKDEVKVHWKSRHRKGYCAVSDTGYAVGYICYAVEIHNRWWECRIL